jgi:chromate transport protein ChrA
MNLPEQAKIVGDVLSISTISATLMSILPPVAAILTILWSLIRIYESETVKRMLGIERKERTRAEDK